MQRRERVGESLQAARAALAALGRRGKTTPIPLSVRARVLAYTRRQRAVGASWQAIARALGVSASALKNWSGMSPPVRRLVPVVVAPAGAEPSPPRLAVVSPPRHPRPGPPGPAPA